MVQSPGDLYDLTERPRSNLNDEDGLVNFGDQDDDPYRPEPPNPVEKSVNWDAFQYYLGNLGPQVISDEALLGAIAGVAAVGLAYVVDDNVDKWANNHQNDGINQAAANLGKGVTGTIRGCRKPP
jgi:hypothetical protein